jgi:hypothetical protein
VNDNNHKKQQEQQQPMHRGGNDDGDDTDDGDDADDRSRHLSTEACTLSETTTVYESAESFCVCGDVAERQQESNKNELTVINRHHCHQRNHCNQFQQQTSTMGVRDACSDTEDNIVREEQQEAFHHRERCPHHPRALLVRFDPAGQAWCDKLDCWDCYRLMKIGEALEYRSLMDQGGNVVIDQGMPAWSAFMLSQRAFLAVATELAIVLCKALGIEVPDVSGEVKRLVEVHPTPS